MSPVSMISPMVDNVAVVMEQKTQDSTKRNKVERGTGRVIDGIAHFIAFIISFFVQVKLSAGWKK